MTVHYINYKLILLITRHLPTNHLAVSQVTDWSTRGLVNSPKCSMKIWSIYNLTLICGRQQYVYTQYSIRFALGLLLG